MIRKNLSLLSIFLITIVCIWNVLNTHRWDDEGIIVDDVARYYGYLPKAFNHKADTLTAEEIRIPGLCPGNKYVTAPNGNKLLKTTMGLAFMYAPFYGFGHLNYYCAHGNPGTGIETEYRRSMTFFGICCLFIALIVLRKLLRKYFSEGIVATTILTLVFGTNAFYYATYEGCMPHIPDFMLFILFLFYIDKWYQKPSTGISALIGFISGLIVLIRPTNILVIILFLFYNVVRIKDLEERIKFFMEKWRLILIILTSAFVIWIPQMIYWHSITGRYIFYSYVGEHFFFSDPRIWQGLFSFRKGWLLYTPIGIFMLTGFGYMYVNTPEIRIG